jgi:type VI secretion system ImpH/TssG family protein
VSGPDAGDAFTRSYLAELEALRREGADFAERYPKIAGRLKLGDEASPDPHVERLLESFAFLTARVQRKLDDDYPQLSQSLLEVLYPQLTRPIPSMAVAELSLDFDQSIPAAGRAVPAGTPFVSKPVRGEPLRFRSTAPARLWPLKIARAEITPPRGDDLARHPRVRSVLTIQVEAVGTKLSELELEELDLYLKGEPATVNELYELLCGGLAGLEAGGKILERSSLEARGFADDEAMLPYPLRSFAGYRLLQEYFAFPAKFHFLRIRDLGDVRRRSDTKLDLRFLLAREPRVPTASVTADNFSLHCVPLINLFESNADPIVVSPFVDRHPVVPDAQRPLDLEVYSILNLLAAPRRPEAAVLARDARALAAQGGRGDRRLPVARRPRPRRDRSRRPHAAPARAVHEPRPAVHERAVGKGRRLPRGRRRGRRGREVRAPPDQDPAAGRRRRAPLAAGEPAVAEPPVAGQRGARRAARDPARVRRRADGGEPRAGRGHPRREEPAGVALAARRVRRRVRARHADDADAGPRPVRGRQRAAVRVRDRAFPRVVLRDQLVFRTVPGDAAGPGRDPPMDAEGGGAGTALIDLLERQSRRFEFVRAAVLLQRLFASAQRPRPFRYTSRPRMRFPAAECELESFPDEEGRPGELRVSTAGLAGLTGPLPAHYAELLAARARGEDGTLKDFLGIFEDRAARLLLDAHLYFRFWLRVAYEGGTEHNAFVDAALAMAGTLTGDQRERCGMPEHAQVYYAGLLGQQPRSASALAGVVEDAFEVTTRIDEFVGGWVAMPPEALGRLGRSRLGVDFVTGDRYYDPGMRFRMRLGPMALPRMRELLPGTGGAESLQRLAGFAAGAEHAFVYTLTVQADDVPPARLTSDPEAPQRLGRTFWLRADDAPREAVAGPFHAETASSRR